MQSARMFALLSLVLATAWVIVPGPAPDVTGSVTAALPAGEALFCEQPLYLEEIELLYGTCS